MGSRNIKVVRTAKRLNRNMLPRLSADHSENPYNVEETHMVSIFQGAVEFIAHMPVPVRIHLKQDTKQCRPLLASPGIPMADISGVVDKCRVTAILPSLILFLHGSKVPIVVHIVREDQVPGSGVVPEVGGGLGGYFTNENWLGGNFERTRRGSGGAVGTTDVYGVEFEVVVILDHFAKSCAGEPEELATPGELRANLDGRWRSMYSRTYGKLGGLEGGLEREENEGLVVSTRELSMRSMVTRRGELTSSPRYCIY